MEKDNKTTYEFIKSDEITNQKFVNILFGDLSTEIIYKGRNEYDYDIFDLTSDELPLRVFIMANCKKNNSDTGGYRSTMLEIIDMSVRVCDISINAELYSNKYTFENYKKTIRKMKYDIYENIPKLFSKEITDLRGKFKGFRSDEEGRLNNLYNNLGILFTDESINVFKSNKTTLCDFSYRKNVKTYSPSYRILLYTEYNDEYILKTDIVTSIKGFFTNIEFTLYEKDSNKVIEYNKAGFIPGKDNKVSLFEKINRIFK